MLGSRAQAQWRCLTKVAATSGEAGRATAQADARQVRGAGLGSTRASWQGQGASRVPRHRAARAGLTTKPPSNHAAPPPTRCPDPRPSSPALPTKPGPPPRCPALTTKPPPHNTPPHSPAHTTVTCAPHHEALAVAHVVIDGAGVARHRLLRQPLRHVGQGAHHALVHLVPVDLALQPGSRTGGLGGGFATCQMGEQRRGLPKNSGAGRQRPVLRRSSTTTAFASDADYQQAEALWHCTLCGRLAPAWRAPTERGLGTQRDQRHTKVGQSKSWDGRRAALTSSMASSIRCRTERGSMSTLPAPRSGPSRRTRLMMPAMKPLMLRMRLRAGTRPGGDVGNRRRCWQQAALAVLAVLTVGAEAPGGALLVGRVRR